MYKKTIVLVFIVSLFSVFLVGCGRTGYEIKPNESAFLIPYTGDTKNEQAAFASEKYLEQNKIAVKRIIIENQWIRGLGNVPEAMLIKVNRAPVTREWTESQQTGTTSKNQGITAESNESIGFMARFNCTALIKEKDSAKYLYIYPSNKGLNNIMDEEIRAVVEGKFTEECSKLTMDKIITSKSEILERTKKFVDDYFEERGVTISVLGYKG